ncbi:MAG: efflux RND transporter periplasmic adaptor subunit [Patescibacteria group bacterium]|nr:efflux RND transporter periplasmic adaptor subunit [Patescibacteria group bacterium]
MKYLIKNKVIIIFLILGLIIGGYLSYRKFRVANSDTSLAVARVIRDDIREIISGSGNIVAVDSLKITTRKGGEIIYFPFDEGDKINKGTLLLEIDSKEIIRQIRDNKLSLASQENNLEKLKLSKSNLENNLKKLESEYASLQRGDEMKKEYEKSLSLLADFFSELPTIIRDVEDVYFSRNFFERGYSSNIEYYLSYFTKNFSDESTKLRVKTDKIKDRLSELSKKFSQIRSKHEEGSNFDFLDQSHKLALDVQDWIKYGLDNIRKIKENASLEDSVHIYATTIDFHFNLLKDNHEKINNYSQLMLETLNRFNSHNDKLEQLVVDMETMKNNIKQSENDIKNLEISIAQTKSKISDLEDDLNDYKIYAPLDGVVKSVYFKKGDLVNSGSVAMEMISRAKVAEIKLNEVDISGIKRGQKAILTFDALPDLEIEGTVNDIDPIGEIDQGVVSYSVKIIFDNSQEQIKTGMTVNADIIIKERKNVLVIPQSAVRLTNGEQFVEVVKEKNLIENHLTTRPRDGVYIIKSKSKLNIDKRSVKLGLSDESKIEVVSGLNEGEWVVADRPKNDKNRANEKQGLFQRMMPNPQRMIRNSGNR